MVMLTEAYATTTVRAHHGEPTTKLGHERCPSELDSLMLTSWPNDTHVGHDVVEDPMFEKFVASLIVSRTMSWPSMECVTDPPTSASTDEAPSEAFYTCTYTPPTPTPYPTQQAMDLPPSLPELEQSQGMPPWCRSPPP